VQWQLEEFTGMLLETGLGGPQSVRQQANMRMSRYTLRPTSSAWQKQSLEGETVLSTATWVYDG